MMGSWSAIPLVRVDLDLPDDEPVLVNQSASRAWVEVVRAGQVVALAEVSVSDGRVTREDVERAAASAPVPTSPEPVEDELLPHVTVVVPSICRDVAQLRTTVANLASLDYPAFDIIVVDNRTDPDAPPLTDLGADGRVRIAREVRPGVSAARNRGVAEASGDVIAFTDDDVVVDPGWLRAIGARFVHNPEVDAIGGLVLPLELRTPAQLWFEEFFGGFNSSFAEELMSLELTRGDPLFPYAPGRFGAGCNMAMRTSALARVGGFDELLGTGTPARGGEDLAMFLALVFGGATVAFEPRAVVRHKHRETDAAFFTQVHGYGIGLTAMFTALVLSDPRHLWRMLRRAPDGFRLLFAPRDQRSPSRHPSYPRRAYAYHLSGMALGPFAYARSALVRRFVRRL